MRITATFGRFKATGLRSSPCTKRCETAMLADRSAGQKVLFGTVCWSVKE